MIFRPKFPKFRGFRSPKTRFFRVFRSILARKRGILRVFCREIQSTGPENRVFGAKITCKCRIFAVFLRFMRCFFWLFLRCFCGVFWHKFDLFCPKLTFFIIFRHFPPKKHPFSAVFRHFPPKKHPFSAIFRHFPRQKFTFFLIFRPKKSHFSPQKHSFFSKKIPQKNRIFSVIPRIISGGFSLFSLDSANGNLTLIKDFGGNANTSGATACVAVAQSLYIVSQVGAWAIAVILVDFWPILKVFKGILSHFKVILVIF
jgi:hypothetical protein